MAELVQQNLELMLPELEQMERVQLLSKDEIKQLLKRRKTFEYALQRREKRQEDFLEYIQYEIALLDLISLRRKKIGYFHKKDDIDLAVAKRINKMFKIIEHRFGGQDEKIYLSHVDFLKKMNWKEHVGKTYKVMLRQHVYKPELWITAAKYEFEGEMNADSARKIFLEGLRFNKDSKALYREVSPRVAHLPTSVQSGAKRFYIKSN